MRETETLKEERRHFWKGQICNLNKQQGFIQAGFLSTMWQARGRLEGVGNR
jgi:hypothetical protein